MSSARPPAAWPALATDVVFVGLTRPAMAFGVPYIAVLANGLATLELFLVTRNLLWLLAAAPFHLATVLVCIAEPRFFELLQVWAITRSRAGFARGGRWGAVSYGPLPPRLRSDTRQSLRLTHAVSPW